MLATPAALPLQSAPALQPSSLLAPPLRKMATSQQERPPARDVEVSIGNERIYYHMVAMSTASLLLVAGCCRIRVQLTNTKHFYFCACHMRLVVHVALPRTSTMPVLASLPDSSCASSSAALFCFSGAQPFLPVPQYRIDPPHFLFSQKRVSSCIIIALLLLSSLTNGNCSGQGRRLLR